VPFASIPRLVKPISPLKDLFAIFEIWRKLRCLRPQLVAAHTAKAGLIARCAAALAGIPAVFTPHGWAITDRISNRQGRVFRRVEQLGACMCARIINVCEYERNLASRNGIARAEKLALVHNGIPDVSCEFFADPEPQPPKLISIARFEQPKDHRTLLHALSELNDLPWSIDLVGDGPLETEVRDLSRKLRLEGRIRFLGVRRDIAPLLARAQLFVLSTRFEAFPYSVLEAMRAGLPIVASDVGGIREAVVSGKMGLLAPAGDAGRLQACLRQLLTKPPLRLEMGAAARDRFLARFTLEPMLAKTCAIYGDVIAEAQGAGQGRKVSGWPWLSSARLRAIRSPMPEEHKP
jgi:glycosyltransferase involved in cell wall biosynthesis